MTPPSSERPELKVLVKLQVCALARVSDISLHRCLASSFMALYSYGHMKLCPYMSWHAAFGRSVTSSSFMYTNKKKALTDGCATLAHARPLCAREPEDLDARLFFLVCSLRMRSSRRYSHFFFWRWHGRGKGEGCKNTAVPCLFFLRRRPRVHAGAHV